VNRKLTLDDIADQRAYEREREAFRDRVIALKKRRRIQVGPIITLVFENTDTIRFQIQEMARAERMLTDEAIQTELDTYNPLIPDAGQLSATLFLELRSKAELEEWLPKLVGIERAVELRIGGGNGDGSSTVVRCEVEAAHAAQLTREETTSAVHYIRVELTPDEVERFATGPVTLAIAHANYSDATLLPEESRAELLQDLRGQ
jgi:hypothetical protein